MKTQLLSIQRNLAELLPSISAIIAANLVLAVTTRRELNGDADCIY